MTFKSWIIQLYNHPNETVMIIFQVILTFSIWHLISKIQSPFRIFLLTLATFGKFSRCYNGTNRLQDSDRRLRESQLSLESIQIGDHSLFYYRQFVFITALILRQFAHGRAPLSISPHFTARKLRAQKTARGRNVRHSMSESSRCLRTMDGYSNFYFLRRKREAASVHYNPLPCPFLASISQPINVSFLQHQS